MAKPKKVSSTERHWADRQEGESLAQHEARLYGLCTVPEESQLVIRAEAIKENEYHPDALTGISVDFGLEASDAEMSALINIMGRDHNCACHKLACLTFFQWDGKQYRQVPLMETEPTTKYLVLGLVEELEAED